MPCSLRWVLAGPEICCCRPRRHRSCCTVSSRMVEIRQGNVLNAHPALPRKSDLTDVDFFLKGLDTKLFPGVKSSVKAHNGFLEEHEKTASQILAEVKKLISTTGATQVITVSAQNFSANLGIRSIGEQKRSPVIYPWPILLRSDTPSGAHWLSSTLCSSPSTCPRQSTSSLSPTAPHESATRTMRPSSTLRCATRVIQSHVN